MHEPFFIDKKEMLHKFSCLHFFFRPSFAKSPRALEVETRAFNCSNKTIFYSPPLAVFTPRGTGAVTQNYLALIGEVTPRPP